MIPYSNEERRVQSKIQNFLLRLTLNYGRIKKRNQTCYLVC